MLLSSIADRRAGFLGEPGSLWDREQIVEGVALVENALKSCHFGSYTLQAAIAAVQAEAESAGVTD